MVRQENEIDRLERIRRESETDRAMKLIESGMVKKYGEVLGESLYQYAYGPLPNDYETPPEVKARVKVRTEFAQQIANKLASPIYVERLHATEALLTANEIVAERIAKAQADQKLNWQKPF